MDRETDSVAGDFVSFRLPAPPISMNAMYQIHYGKRQVYMKPEVRTYKTTMKMYVPRFDVPEDGRVGIRFSVHDDWYFKNGKMRKKDVHNLCKVLTDLVTEKMGFDDSLVWEFQAVKVQDKKDRHVDVRVWRLVEAKTDKTA